VTAARKSSKVTEEQLRAPVVSPIRVCGSLEKGRAYANRRESETSQRQLVCGAGRPRVNEQKRWLLRCHHRSIRSGRTDTAYR
jgi:hypothetical protein